VRDLSEVVKPRASRTRREIRVVYQDACHLAHGQRIRAQPRALLRAIEGVTLVDIADPERCCGSAGIYNLSHPEISRELQKDKVRAIVDVGPDVVVSANPGCMLQVRSGLEERGRDDLPVLHLVEVLDRAMS
jgi:glycolate oxidase iron-sulfur subunit